MFLVCFLKSLYNSSHLKGCNSNFAVAWASGFAVCWWKPCSVCVHAWVLSVTLKFHSSQKDRMMLGLLELAQKTFRYSFTKIHSGSNHYCILDVSAACLQAGIPLQGDIMSYIVILFKVVYF